MPTTESPQIESLTLSGTINSFETATHSGFVVLREKQPKKWDSTSNTMRDAVPAHWHVTLSPAVDPNRAWRSIGIPLARCRDLESAARLAMRLLPANQIVMRGTQFGGVFTVKRNTLVEIW